MNVLFIVTGACVSLKQEGFSDLNFKPVFVNKLHLLTLNKVVVNKVKSVDDVIMQSQ